MKLQIGVKVLIKNSEGFYLFIKRSQLLPGSDQPSWDIPGGRIESEESLQTALARELKEETGLSLSGEVVLINAQDIFVASKDLHVVRLTYTTTLEAATITLSDEHLESSWMTLAHVLTLNVEPYLRESLLMLSAGSQQDSA